MSTDKHERWIVGLDLSARSHGARVFAAWIRHAPSPAARPIVVGVHVLETWVARHLSITPDEYVRTVRAAIERHGAEIGGDVDNVEVVAAERAEDGLAAAAAGADALVIGRSAARGDRPLVRLGRVARRLLRRLPAPVFVVPPDLAPEALERGPIVLATDMTPATANATRFAVDLARAHARPLVLAHVGEPRHGDLIDELEPRWLEQRDRYRSGVAASFAAWAEAQGLAGLRRAIEFGGGPESLAAIAEREQAALIVVGSRRLSAVERVFTTSTASALAGLCVCPVGVVPPAEA